MSEDRGVALVNVLVLLAITSGLVVLMLSQQEEGRSALGRATALAQAEQIALGAEASVLSALRADLDTAPEQDHFAEAWASVIQQEVQLPEGLFSVAVTDLQAKFDLNSLSSSVFAPRETFLRLCTALDIPEAEARRIIQLMTFGGPYPRLDSLRDLGISDDTVDRLAPHVTALPRGGTVNLNTADPLLLGVLMQNPGATAQLLRRREIDGFLTRETLSDYGALRPPLTGFGSHAWQAEIRASSNGATVRLNSVIQRKDDLDGKAIAVLSRIVSYEDALPDED